MDEKLPVREIFLRGMKMPFENYQELIRLGWPYALLLLLSSFIPEAIGGFVSNLLYFLLSCLTGVLALVGCHRVFLLPEEAVKETPTLRWSYRETKFLLCLIGLGVVASLFSIPFMAAIFGIFEFEHLADDDNVLLILLVTMIALLPMYYIVSRWSLILPDASVDQDRTFSWAWNMSSQHSFRLFILIGALPVTTSVILEYLVLFIQTPYLTVLLHNVIWLVVAVFEVCLLSLSYEWIVSNHRESE